MSIEINEFENKHKKKKIDLMDENLYQLSKRIFKNDLILENILKNFSPKELQSISRVSKQWFNLSQNMIKKNNKSEDFFYLYNEKKFSKDLSDKYFETNQLENAIDFNNLKNLVHDKFKNNLKTVPSLVIMFNSLKVYQQKKFESFIKVENFENFFPKSCSIVNVNSEFGIIGRINKSNSSLETMYEEKLISGISCFILPNLNYLGCEILTVKNNQSELLKYFELNSQYKVKCILTFLKFEYSTSPNLKVLESIVKKNSNVAVGGVLLENINALTNTTCIDLNNSKKINKASFLSILFCGDCIKAASLVLNESDVNELETKLDNFKKNLDFDDSNFETIGFIFTCAGRGINKFSTSNLETSLFQKYFINTKFYGIFGLGEIGVNSYGLHKDNFKNKEIMHYYTTVLVLVQIQKKN